MSLGPSVRWTSIAPRVRSHEYKLLSRRLRPAAPHGLTPKLQSHGFALIATVVRPGTRTYGEGVRLFVTDGAGDDWSELTSDQRPAARPAWCRPHQGRTPGSDGHPRHPRGRAR